MAAGICVAIGHEFVTDTHVTAWEYFWMGCLLLSQIPFAAFTVYLESLYRQR